MAWLDRLSEGLARTRKHMSEGLNVLLERSPKVDDDFWDELEESLICADFGAIAASHIIAALREEATRYALPDAAAVLAHLAEKIAARFTVGEDVLALDPVCVLFVGINGSGKTTTVGKLAKAGVTEGRSVLVGSADTFRAAAIEQLDVWAERAGVPVIKRHRGSDPASVAYEVVDAAFERGANLVLVDTAGRLHTSDDLMRELAKVVAVARKRAEAAEVAGLAEAADAAEAAEAAGVTEPARGSQGAALPVKTVLVIDATTGQNGLVQAREFNARLELDGVIITKLDGTAKGGIAVAISEDLKLPILRIGVGEKIDDLRAFEPLDFARALIGAGE